MPGEEGEEEGEEGRGKGGKEERRGKEKGRGEGVCKQPCRLSIIVSRDSPVQQWSLGSILASSALFPPWKVIRAPEEAPTADHSSRNMCSIKNISRSKDAALCISAGGSWSN